VRPGPWLLDRRAQLGLAATQAGILYAANTAGAAAGALAAGFWLIPAYGVRISTWSAVGLNVLAAAGAMAIRRSAIGGQPALDPGADAAREALRTMSR
jgi:hypothetical protein